MAEVEDRVLRACAALPGPRSLRAVGDAVVAEFDPGEPPHRLAVIQSPFGHRIAQSLPVLEEVDPQHRLRRQRWAFGALARRSIFQSLWLATSETCSMANPASNRRLVPSWRNSWKSRPQLLGLFRDQRPAVEACGGEVRDPLVIHGLVTRALPVADQEHATVDVEIGPFDAADLVAPQRGGDGELDDPHHGQGQAFVVIAAAEEAGQFSRRRATVALDALVDQTEALERDPCQIDGFGRDVEARAPPPHG